MVKILFEDANIIVVVKPRGVLSQPNGKGTEDILQIVKAYLKEKYQKPGDVYLALPHRLDRNTSGIMVLAKRTKAQTRLASDFSTHNHIVKKYLALVEGEIVEAGEYNDKLSKNEKELKAYIDANGKEAILKYKPLEIKNNSTLVEVELITGRFHQIRCQFAYHNHVLVGDKLYGSKINKNYYLHAYYLEFAHPITKEIMKFTDK